MREQVQPFLSVILTKVFFPGQRTLHHKSDVLETVVLVNPSQDSVVSEVKLIYLVLFLFLTKAD